MKHNLSVVRVKQNPQGTEQGGMVTTENQKYILWHSLRKYSKQGKLKKLNIKVSNESSEESFSCIQIVFHLDLASCNEQNKGVMWWRCFIKVQVFKNYLYLRNVSE